MASNDLRNAINNPNTKIILTFNKKAVSGFTTEDFSGGGQNNWTSLFETGAQQAFSGTVNQLASAATAIAKATGFDVGSVPQIQLIPKQQTAVMWTGSSRPQFTIPLYFVATGPDAVDDPRVPVQALMDTVYPNETDVGEALFNKKLGMNALSAPLGYRARSLGGAVGTVNLEIGNWFRVMGLLLVNSVNYTFSKEITKNGFPLYAKVNISFEAYRVITAREAKAFFIIKPDSSSTWIKGA